MSARPALEAHAAGHPVRAVTRSMEQERAAARAAGYAAGWSAGAQAAQATLAQELADLRARADVDGAAHLDRVLSAVEAVERACAQAREAALRSAHDLADEVLDIALQLAAAVLTHEPLASSSPGRDALARALAAHPPASGPVVRLSPSDAATLAGVDLPPGVHVVADPALAGGDAVLEHSEGRVEMLLSAGLARARAVLLP